MAPTTKSGKRASIRARAAAKSQPQRTTFEELGQAFAEPGDNQFNPSPLQQNGADGSDAFNFLSQPTKRQKREEKSTFFKSRIATTAPAGEGRGISKNRNAHRRATKKKNTTLTASLTALADALPSMSLSAAATGAGMNEGLEEMRRKLLEDVSIKVSTSRSGNVAVGGAVAKRMKTLSTRPGMNKRREKLLRSERERFGRNMAVMLQDGSVFRAANGIADGKEEEMKDGSSNDAEVKVGGGGITGPGGAAAGLKALRGFIQERMAVQNAIP